tara:strand:+ start:1597 stop:1872 length:276 start_codon:yes stop_codon:yes gene_type:complete
MSRYYCPFCSTRYEFHKTETDGNLICGLCGEQLIKKPLLNSKRIIGVIATSAFLYPLLIMVIYLIQDFTKEKLPNDTESIAFVTIYKSWNI